MPREWRLSVVDDVRNGIKEWGKSSVTGNGKVSDARTFSAIDRKIDPRELQIELILHGVRVFSESLGGLDVGTSAALRGGGAGVQVDATLRGQTQFPNNYDATAALSP